MKNVVIPDINRIIKIIAICFLAMLVVINIPAFSLIASLFAILIFALFITPSFIILSKKYLTKLEIAFCQNNFIPSNIISNPIALSYLKKQLLSQIDFRVIRSLNLLATLNYEIPPKIYQNLAANNALTPYLLNFQPLDQLLSYLNDDNLIRKQIALEKLLINGNENQKEIASTHLKSLISSNNADFKIMSARIIGKTKKTEFFEQIVSLFDDAEINVKRIALITAGKCGDESFIPHIINSLKNESLFYDACKALASFSDNISFDVVNNAFKTTPYKLKKTFLQHFIFTKSKVIIKLLVDNLNGSDLLTKRVIIKCLLDVNLVKTEETYPKLKTCLYDLTNHATWILSTIGDVATSLETSELKRILKYEFDLTKEAVFNLLPIIVPETKKFISLSNDEKLDKNYCSTEELANALPEEIKIICMPLIEHLSLQERTSRLKPHFSQSSIDFEQRLIQIFMADFNKNLFLSRAYAVLVASNLKNPVFFDYFKKALSDNSIAVKETAEWAIANASKE